VRVHRDLALLDPRFRPEAERLCSLAVATGNILQPFETLRSNERQAHLHSIGRTTRISEPKRTRLGPGESAHNHGMAIDLVENTGPAKWPWVWKTGLDSRRRTVIDAERWAMWEAIEAILKADFPLIQWGGDFGRLPPKRIGWDPWHFELKGWRRLV
jgi:hypothetical protein